MSSISNSAETLPVIIGEKEYFSGIDKISYEGRESDNPMAFKYYEECCWGVAL